MFEVCKRGFSLYMFVLSTRLHFVTCALNFFSSFFVVLFFSFHVTIVFYSLHFTVIITPMLFTVCTSPFKIQCCAVLRAWDTFLNHHRVYSLNFQIFGTFNLVLSTFYTFTVALSIFEVCKRGFSLYMFVHIIQFAV